MSDQPEAVSEPSSEAGTTEVRIKLRLHKPHQLIVQAIEQQQREKEPGYSYAYAKPTVRIHATAKQYRFGLAILDPLFKMLEQQGFKVAIDDSRYGHPQLCASNGWDKCEIALHEIHRQIPHEPTAQEKADKERWNWKKIPKWDQIPTGEFSLTPGGKVDLRSEETFATFLARSCASIAETIERAKEQRKQREAYERKEAECQRLRREEEERGKAFRESAESLHQYRIMMSYIEEVRRHKRIPRNQLREGQSLDEWLQWAEEQARSFHPLGH